MTVLSSFPLTDNDRLGSVFARACQAMPVGLMLADAQLRVVYCNAAMAALTELDGPSWVGCRIPDLRQHFDEDQLGGVDWEGVGATGASTSFRVRRTRLGATSTYKLTIEKLCDDHGDVEGVLVTGEDVTEMVRLQLELGHDQKLEAVGRLASGIAHEINTPIQFVGDNIAFIRDAFSSFVDLVREVQWMTSEEAGNLSWADRRARLSAAEARCDADFLVEEVPKAAEQAADGIERVVKIVKAMRAFGHPGGATAEWADLNEALRNTAVVATNETKPVAEVHLELSPLPLVRCRLADLNQVFLNLIVNAAHAIGDRVKGTIERGSITISTALDDDGRAVVSVTDTGSGMPAEVRARIFEPFFTTKEVGRGTGQGLAIAYAVVVEGHGGNIEVDSVPGQGTTFRIILPVEGRP